MLNTISDAITQLLPAKRKTSANKWTSFNAPCCVHNGESQDTRSRGGVIINPDGGISYHCFNCHFKASYTVGFHLNYKFRKLLSWLGADDNTIRRLVIDAVRVKDLVGATTEVVPVEKTEVVFKPRPLPAEARDLASLYTFYTMDDNRNVPEGYNDSLRYIGDRTINMQKYPFYWTPETAYNLHKRVIIPFTWNNEIIGYTARAIVDGVKPKYYSQYEPNYVFNVDKQKPDSKFVIVCEGPFDAMAIDGVAVLSNECSEEQADIIDSLNREVILVPDSDKAGAALIEDAIEYGWTVSFPVWLETCKDINEAVTKYGKLFVLNCILSSRETNRLKIELRKKKLFS